MSKISAELAEELLSYSNELHCAKDTIASVAHSDTLVITNLENGSSEKELTEPFEYLFNMSMKKPHFDVQYVSQDKKEVSMNIGESCNDLNVYDLETFLLALRPDQSSLIDRIVEQCNIYSNFITLISKIHLLNTFCERPVCQGRIIAGSRFTKQKNSCMKFRIAHPPFIYELEQLLKYENDSDIENYLLHLQQYLENPIQNDSCILCLSYDLYCTDSADIQNFRLFFLHKESARLSCLDSIDSLYETEIKDPSKVDQCFLFDSVLQNIQIIRIEHHGETKFILRYTDKGKVRLFI